MDFIFKVDPIRRNIKVPDGFTVLTMDHNIHKLVFVCPYYEDFAFDSASIVFMIDAPDGRQYSIPAEEYESFPNSPSPYVKFTLTLRSYITSVPGYISFCITADIISSGNVIEKSWHSKNISISVGSHINNDDSEDIPEEDVPTINQRLNNLDSKVGMLQTTVNGMANGTPPTASSTSEMDPDESTLYINTTDGNWYYYNGSAWTSGGQYGGAITDSTLSIAGRAADAAAVRQLINGVSEELDDKADSADIDGLDQRVTALEEGGSGSGITAAVKNALLALFRNVVYAGANGQALYDDLYDAFYDVTAIRLDNYSLVFTTTGDTAQITATTVPAGGTVTWESSDTSVATVDQTGLVTSVGYGSAVITATSGSASASCSITVSQVTLLSISANYTQSGRVYPSTALDSLKSDLIVTASWSDGTTSTVAGSNYVLSGTLTAGTRQVTVSYGGKTATFNVVVSPMYTVSNNLTHCITNNDATSIGEGQAYRATITADEGYQLDTATITMGGTDVTATVYNAGVINIASVTGSIIITVTTSEDMTGVLHYIDFTQSLVDQVTGDTVTPCANSRYSSTPPTRDSNGLSFTGIAQYVPIAQVTFPCTIEMKVGACAITGTAGNNRFIMLGAAFDTDGMFYTVANGKGPFIYHGVGSNIWSAYSGSWTDYTTRITARDDIADSIIKIYLDANGVPHLTVNGVSYGTANTSFLSTPYLQLGTASNSDAVANLTVEYIKVYDGEV